MNMPHETSYDSPEFNKSNSDPPGQAPLHDKGSFIHTRSVKLTNEIQLEMIYIPPGQFKTINNITIHISKGFWIGRYPITQEQWEAVMGKNPSICLGVGPKAPVDNLSWQECQMFIDKENKDLGIDLRLPSEAEWEYACRAGTTTQLNNGKSVTTASDHCPNLDEVAWNGGGWQDQIESSQPVGQKKPNAWGLYDMHGNVWEWCNDWDGDYPPEDGVINPSGPSSGMYRVIRGGSWYSAPVMFGSSKRDSIQPDYKSNDLGFRVVCNFEKHLSPPRSD